jgi:hypothetical protein
MSTTETKREARRRQGERITESNPEGLLIRRNDGRWQRVGPRGVLQPMTEGEMGYTIEEFAAAHGESRAQAAEIMTQDVVEALTMLARVHGVHLQLTVIGNCVLVTTEGGGLFAVTVMPADDDGRRQ